MCLRFLAQLLSCRLVISKGDFPSMGVLSGKDRFSVIVDTNAIRENDIAKIVSPGFEAGLSECRKLLDIGLLIPEVVFGERCYQLVGTAKHSLESASKNLGNISKVTGIAHLSLPTIPEVQNAIHERLHEWMKKNGATLAKTPVCEIDWSRVVSDAVWRLPPFEPSGESQKEKGFRDCMVLETVASIVKASGATPVVFISNDALLRETAQKRLHGNAFFAYADLGSFLSYQKLLHEQFTELFIGSISEKAPAVFYSPNDKTCVWSRFEVEKKVKEEFKENKFSTDEGLFGATVTYTLHESKTIIGGTEFLKREGETFHWKTSLEHARLFTPSGLGLNRLREALLEKIRRAQVEVFWKVTISESEIFSDPSLERISKGEEREIPALIESQKYGFSPVEKPELPPLPESLPPNMRLFLGMLREWGFPVDEATAKLPPKS